MAAASAYSKTLNLPAVIDAHALLIQRMSNAIYEAKTKATNYVGSDLDQQFDLYDDFGNRHKKKEITKIVAENPTFVECVSQLDLLKDFIEYLDLMRSLLFMDPKEWNRLNTMPQYQETMKHLLPMNIAQKNQVGNHAPIKYLYESIGLQSMPTTSVHQKLYAGPSGYVGGVTMDAVIQTYKTNKHFNKFVWKQYFAFDFIRNEIEQQAEAQYVPNPETTYEDYLEGKVNEYLTEYSPFLLEPTPAREGLPKPIRMMDQSVDTYAIKRIIASIYAHKPLPAGVNRRKVPAYIFSKYKVTKNKPYQMDDDDPGTYYALDQAAQGDTGKKRGLEEPSDDEEEEESDAAAKQVTKKPKRGYQFPLVGGYFDSAAAQSANQFPYLCSVFHFLTALKAFVGDLYNILTMAKVMMTETYEGERTRFEKTAMGTTLNFIRRYYFASIYGTLLPYFDATLNPLEVDLKNKTRSWSVLALGEVTKFKTEPMPLTGREGSGLVDRLWANITIDNSNLYEPLYAPWLFFSAFQTISHTKHVVRADTYSFRHDMVDTFILYRNSLLTEQMSPEKDFMDPNYELPFEFDAVGENSFIQILNKKLKPATAEAIEDSWLSTVNWENTNVVRSTQTLTGKLAYTYEQSMRIKDETKGGEMTITTSTLERPLFSWFMEVLLPDKKEHLAFSPEFFKALKAENVPTTPQEEQQDVERAESTEDKKESTDAMDIDEVPAPAPAPAVEAGKEKEEEEILPNDDNLDNMDTVPASAPEEEKKEEEKEEKGKKTGKQGAGKKPKTPRQPKAAKPPVEEPTKFLARPLVSTAAHAFDIIFDGKNLLFSACLFEWLGIKHECKIRKMYFSHMQRTAWLPNVMTSHNSNLTIFNETTIVSNILVLHFSSLYSIPQALIHNGSDDSLKNLGRIHIIDPPEQTIPGPAVSINLTTASLLRKISYETVVGISKERNLVPMKNLQKFIFKRDLASISPAAGKDPEPIFVVLSGLSEFKRLAHQLNPSQADTTLETAELSLDNALRVKIIDTVKNVLDTAVAKDQTDLFIIFKNEIAPMKFVDILPTKYPAITEEEGSDITFGTPARWWWDANLYNDSYVDQNRMIYSSSTYLDLYESFLDRCEEAHHKISVHIKSGRIAGDDVKNFTQMLEDMDASKFSPENIARWSGALEPILSRDDLPVTAANRPAADAMLTKIQSTQALIESSAYLRKLDVKNLVEKGFPGLPYLGDYLNGSSASKTNYLNMFDDLKENLYQGKFLEYIDFANDDKEIEVVTKKMDLSENDAQWLSQYKLLRIGQSVMNWLTEEASFPFWDVHQYKISEQLDNNDHIPIVAPDGVTLVSHCYDTLDKLARIDFIKGHSMSKKTIYFAPRFLDGELSNKSSMLYENHWMKNIMKLKVNKEWSSLASNEEFKTLFHGFDGIGISFSSFKFKAQYQIETIENREIKANFAKKGLEQIPAAKRFLEDNYIEKKTSGDRTDAMITGSTADLKVVAKNANDINKEDNLVKRRRDAVMAGNHKIDVEDDETHEQSSINIFEVIDSANNHMDMAQAAAQGDETVTPHLQLLIDFFDLNHLDVAKTKIIHEIDSNNPAKHHIKMTNTITEAIGNGPLSLLTIEPDAQTQYIIQIHLDTIFLLAAIRSIYTLISPHFVFETFASLKKDSIGDESPYLPSMKNAALGNIHVIDTKKEDETIPNLIAVGNIPNAYSSIVESLKEEQTLLEQHSREATDIIFARVNERLTSAFDKFKTRASKTNAERIKMDLEEFNYTHPVWTPISTETMKTHQISMASPALYNILWRQRLWTDFFNNPLSILPRAEGTKYVETDPDASNNRLVEEKGPLTEKELLQLYYKKLYYSKLIKTDIFDPEDPGYVLFTRDAPLLSDTWDFPILGTSATTVSVSTQKKMEASAEDKKQERYETQLKEKLAANLPSMEPDEKEKEITKLMDQRKLIETTFEEALQHYQSYPIYDHNNILYANFMFMSMVVFENHVAKSELLKKYASWYTTKFLAPLVAYQIPADTYLINRYRTVKDLGEILETENLDKSEHDEDDDDEDDLEDEDLITEDEKKAADELEKEFSEEVLFKKGIEIEMMPILYASESLSRALLDCKQRWSYHIKVQQEQRDAKTTTVHNVLVKHQKLLEQLGSKVAAKVEKDEEANEPKNVPEEGNEGVVGMKAIVAKGIKTSMASSSLDYDDELNLINYLRRYYETDYPLTTVNWPWISYETIRDKLIPDLQKEIETITTNYKTITNEKNQAAPSERMKFNLELIPLEIKLKTLKERVKKNQLHLENLQHEYNTQIANGIEYITTPSVSSKSTLDKDNDLKFEIVAQTLKYDKTTKLMGTGTDTVFIPFFTFTRPFQKLPIGNPHPKLREMLEFYSDIERLWIKTSNKLQAQQIQNYINDFKTGKTLLIMDEPDYNLNYVTKPALLALPAPPSTSNPTKPEPKSEVQGEGEGGDEAKKPQKRRKVLKKSEAGDNDEPKGKEKETKRLRKSKKDDDDVHLFDEEEEKDKTDQMDVESILDQFRTDAAFRSSIMAKINQRLQSSSGMKSKKSYAAREVISKMVAAMLQIYGNENGNTTVSNLHIKAILQQKDLVQKHWKSFEALIAELSKAQMSPTYKVSMTRLENSSKEVTNRKDYDFTKSVLESLTKTFFSKVEIETFVPFFDPNFNYDEEQAETIPSYKANLLANMDVQQKKFMEELNELYYPQLKSALSTADGPLHIAIILKNIAQQPILLFHSVFKTHGEFWIQKFANREDITDVEVNDFLNEGAQYGMYAYVRMLFYLYILLVDEESVQPQFADPMASEDVNKTKNNYMTELQEVLALIVTPFSHALRNYLMAVQTPPAPAVPVKVSTADEKAALLKKFIKK